ncbi:acyl-CoA dehydrogenase [Parahaliea maris]|uniref:Acyl-CoA dehydrogenase n=1 Tax=Parahaliea maris TaxID=2716870 RepID=A0A5C8ZQQ9_9GAMM|nr:acyl-CoA dehydrogenase family protein [Parahaliea maris]TXS89837.1 acyl-CoA dehydrogenase [Parahaliea maris]
MSVAHNTALAFDEDQAMIMEVARNFCRERSPIEAVRAQLDTPQGYDEALWQEIVGLGWPGLALPEHVGGSGLGIAHAVAIAESMGRALLGTPLLSTTLAGQLVARATAEARVDVFLADVAAGVPATVALQEGPDWGSDACDCRFNDSGVLQGAKQYVQDAEAAGWFVVVTRHRDMPALALVQAEQLPVGAIRPHTLIDETKRAATVDFSGVQLTPDVIIAGDQVTVALCDYYLLGALLTAAEATGSAAACLDTTVEYLKTRKQFGKLIGSYQALKHPCVDILMAIDSARSFIYHAASLLEDGPLSRDAEIACRMAKAQASDTLLQAGDRAVQFHGGMGFTYECDAQLYIRRAQWSNQQFGDAMHHRKRLATLLLDAED